MPGRWEELLHDHGALRRKVRPRLLGGVMVTSVPFLLESAAADAEAERALEAASEAHRHAEALDATGRPRA